MKYLPLLLLLLGAAPTLAQTKPAKKPVVKTQPAADSSGYLAATVKIAGLCPKQPCNPTPQQLAAVYKNLQLVVTQPEKKWAGKYNLDAKGACKIKLPAGHYNVLVNPKEGSALESMVKPVIIEMGKTATLNLEHNAGS